MMTANEQKAVARATEVQSDIDVSNSVTLLSLLRAIFRDPNYVGAENGIQAYVLPRTDAHQSEYISSRDSRVEFISGFSGSNAYVVITESEALLWTDGRYFNQAEAELSSEWKLMKYAVPDEIKPIDWIVRNLPAGSSVGFDPNIFGFAEGKNFVDSLHSYGISALPIAKQNLIDIIWENRPAEEFRKVICLDVKECGEESNAKIERVRQQMRLNKCDSLVLTLLDDIAWLLNIRGFDIPFNPLVFSVVILNFTDVFLFIDEQKLSPEVQRHLGHVKVFSYNVAAEFLSKYHKRFREEYTDAHKIWLPESVNYALGALIGPNFAHITPSPVQLMKAVKNDVELLGMRNSSIRDSAAIVQFLLWIRRELDLGHLVDEDRAAKQMDYYRSQIPSFVSPSFETISAVGENASLPHYHHSTDSNKKLSNAGTDYDSYYLIDSGGQYRDGTTDVTRTIYYGTTPNDKFRKMFTLVLRGHIDMATLIFPEGVNGIRIDALTREALWREGFDYEHGTGHGVGAFLNVHESPPYIGSRRFCENGGIKKGMIVTIEPGYYEKGQFGIRIENCYEIVAVNPSMLTSKAENFVTFTPLTFVPIQKTLVVKELLDDKHINWLNAYHNRCLELVGKYLQERGLQEEYNYLAEACTPF